MKSLLCEPGASITANGKNAAVTVLAQRALMVRYRILRCLAAMSDLAITVVGTIIAVQPASSEFIHDRR
jgi:hypothetical protein